MFPLYAHCLTSACEAMAQACPGTSTLSVLGSHPPRLTKIAAMGVGRSQCVQVVRYMALFMSLGSTAAAAYLYIQTYLQESDIRVLAGLKVLPISTLAAGVSFRGRDPEYQAYIQRGLLFSMLGDVLLELEEWHPLLFIGGLSAFMWAHVCYIFAFMGHLGPLELSDRRLWCSGAVFLSYAGVLMSYLIPGADSVLVFPICLYALVLSLMGGMATQRLLDRTSTPSLFSCMAALIGALVFMASDSLLGIDKFHHRLAHGKVLVMCTYYLGQACIATSSMTMEAEGYKFD